MSGASVSLGNVASIERIVVDPAEVSPDSLYIGLENIEKGGDIIGVGTVGQAGLSSAKFKFTENHILFGKLRPYLAKIGRPEFEGICSTDILPILPGPNLDRSYLAHFLRLPETIALATARATGANLPRVSPKEVASFEIPVPSLEEQRRIAEILDQADVLLAKRRKSAALLDGLIRSVFFEMFGGSASGYQASTVGELAADRKNSIRTGPFGSQLLHSEFVESGVPVLGIDNAVNNEFRWAKRRFITNEKYQKLARYRVFPGDVVITIMGTCGRCAVVPEDIGVAINTKHLCCISLDRNNCLPEFLHSYFLMHPIARSYLQRTAKGAIMSGLNMNIIKAMPVALPPLAHQERYVAVARRVQEQKLRQLGHLGHLEELFDSLQTRAFHGEL